MQAMRDLMRASLSRTLEGVRDEDRLAAAWTVACGRAMAERGTIVGYADGIVRIEVADAVWLHQMQALRGSLERDLARISGVRVQSIDLHLKRNSSRR